MRNLTRSILANNLRDFLGSSYALIDYPNYLNPGDSAIWLGTRSILEELFQVPPAYISTLKNFNLEQCQRVVDGGPIFFLGGGNFGDLYKKHNSRRLEIIGQISSNPVIMLPLSIANSDQPDTNLQTLTEQTLSKHPNLIMFVREQMSNNALKERYGVSPILCPDLAHFLRLSEYQPGLDALRLIRQDIEKAQQGGTDNQLDWESIKGMKMINRLGKASAILPNGKLRRLAYDFFASRKTMLAAKALGSAHHIETDRLHAVILASILGRSVRVFDNRTGKVFAYVSCWKSYLDNVSYQQSD